MLLPVDHVPLTNSTFVKPDGNDKTFRWMGVIGGISQGCLGALTGFAKSDIPCFSDPDGRCGCYAATNQLVAQRGNQQKLFSIVSNGIHNDCRKTRLPLR